MMRKAIAIGAALFATGALAQGTPSSKATAAINTAVSCKMASATTGDAGLPTAPMSCTDIWTGAAVPVQDGFATVMSAPIKVSNSQSLFVSPSLVTGLYTQTATKTKTGTTSSSTATAGVYLRAVLLDAAGNVVQIADPIGACNDAVLGCQRVGSDYGVVLDQRVQTLTQSISDCIVNVNVGGTDYAGTCTFDSTIDLILKTTSAHGFNFIFPNVGQGVYTVAVQAAVDASAVINAGSAAAVGSAAFGLGSMTVESVRLVHDFSF